MSTDIKNDETPLGDLFLRAFFRLFQIVKIHRSDNQLLIDSVSEFVNAVAQAFADDDKVDLQIYHGRFFLQGEKLIHHPEMSKLVEDILNYLKRRHIHGLRFHSTIREQAIHQIVSFLELLNKADCMENPSDWLLEQLREKNHTWVEILNEPDSSIIAHDPELSVLARATYSHALTTIKSMAVMLTSQNRVGIRKAKRAIQDMVEILTEDDSILLGMSTIRDYDDYTYAHSVNVALLSMCLGNRLGVSRLTLERIGLCGLFHDLGKVDIPSDLINKTSKLTNDEYEEVKKHSINSVRHIIKLNADHILKARILLPPFEHHLGFDLSGYPQTDRKSPVSLLGRILTIADVYDALTSARSYRPTAISPDRALQIMIGKSGALFDPLVLKVFINMIGIYPVGSLLSLDNGQMCIVLGTPDVSKSIFPLAVLIHYGTGGEFRKGERVDLSERNPQTGAFLRSIIKVLHPADYGIQPADFLV